MAIVNLFVSSSLPFFFFFLGRLVCHFWVGRSIRNNNEDGLKNIGKTQGESGISPYLKFFFFKKKLFILLLRTLGEKSSLVTLSRDNAQSKHKASTTILHWTKQGLQTLLTKKDRTHGNVSHSFGETES